MKSCIENCLTSVEKYRLSLNKLLYTCTDINMKHDSCIKRLHICSTKTIN